jgi:hypothetical protein
LSPQSDTLVEKQFEQTRQVNNLLDESSHKHLQNFPQKIYFMIKTLYIDLASHMALFQSSQKQQKHTTTMTQNS